MEKRKKKGKKLGEKRKKIGKGGKRGKKKKLIFIMLLCDLQHIDEGMLKLMYCINNGQEQFEN